MYIYLKYNFKNFNIKSLLKNLSALKILMPSREPESNNNLVTVSIMNTY